MAKRISTAVSRASSRVLRQTAELMRNFPTPSQAALKNGALRGFLDVPDVAVQLPEPREARLPVAVLERRLISTTSMSQNCSLKPRFFLFICGSVLRNTSLTVYHCSTMNRNPSIDAPHGSIHQKKRTSCKPYFVISRNICGCQIVVFLFIVR